MHTVPTEEKAIVSLTRTLPASRERVFHVWTDPEEIKRWFGPANCQVIETKVDLRVAAGRVLLAGEISEVIPPAKLVYTWQWEDDSDYADRETLVTVEFIDLGGSTEVRLTHENLPSAQSVKNHEHGWSGSLDKLESLF
jgi:uncharacterized protein YndB with AHSA1/START domain